MLIFVENTVIIVIAGHADYGVLHFYRKRSRCKLGRFLLFKKKKADCLENKTVCCTTNERACQSIWQVHLHRAVSFSNTESHAVSNITLRTPKGSAANHSSRLRLHGSETIYLISLYLRNFKSQRSNAETRGNFGRDWLLKQALGVGCTIRGIYGFFGARGARREQSLAQRRRPIFLLKKHEKSTKP